MHNKMIYIFSLLVFIGIFSKEIIASEQLSYKELSKDKNITTLWNKAKSELNKSAIAVEKTPIELYFLGMNSKNILEYAFSQKKQNMIDELLLLYLKSLISLEYKREYKFFHTDEKDKESIKRVEKNFYVWTDDESTEEIISSAQFLLVISIALDKISQIEVAKRSITMKKFSEKFTPIVLDHYRRWIFGVKEKKSSKLLGHFHRRGWGCKDNTENYIYGRTLETLVHDLTDKSYHGASYCNVIDDSILLVTTGLGYFLSAKKDQELRSFFLESVSLIRKNFLIIKDKNRKILSFQNGAWFGHPDYDYSNYTNSVKLPIKINQKSIKSVGIDLSHSRRVLSFLELLYTHKKLFDISFPSQLDMQMFSNGFVYKIFNRNFKEPLFSNYMDGSNGWYRVNYSGRKGFGYAPYNLSSTALLSGYPRLAKYNSDVKKIFITLFKKINSTDNVDRKFIKKYYENTVWSAGKLKKEYAFYEDNIDGKTALFLMNFYSSIPSFKGL